MDSWILDTEATHHVGCSLSSFHLSYPIANSFVTFPNGVSVLVCYIGSVRLNAHIVLDNVLFIPQYHFNLVSISAITCSHHCFVTFHSDSYVIQDHIPAKMIGMGRRHGNLYVMDRPNKSSIKSVTAMFWLFYFYVAL